MCLHTLSSSLKQKRISIQVVVDAMDIARGKIWKLARAAGYKELRHCRKRTQSSVILPCSMFIVHPTYLSLLNMIAQIKTWRLSSAGIHEKSTVHAIYVCLSWNRFKLRCVPWMQGYDDESVRNSELLFVGWSGAVGRFMELGSFYVENYLHIRVLRNLARFVYLLLSGASFSIHSRIGQRVQFMIATLTVRESDLHVKIPIILVTAAVVVVFIYS